MDLPQGECASQPVRWHSTGLDTLAPPEPGPRVLVNASCFSSWNLVPLRLRRPPPRCWADPGAPPADHFFIGVNLCASVDGSAFAMAPFHGGGLNAYFWLLSANAYQSQKSSSVLVDQASRLASVSLLSPPSQLIIFLHTKIPGRSRGFRSLIAATCLKPSLWEPFSPRPSSPGRSTW